MKIQRDLRTETASTFAVFLLGIPQKCGGSRAVYEVFCTRSPGVFSKSLQHLNSDSLFTINARQFCQALSRRKNRILAEVLHGL